jgi:hypothetical protein
MSAAGQVRYVGADRNGAGCTGCTAENAARLAERLFCRGWRWLRITSDEDGREVGGIGLSGDRPRKRVWWAET